MRRLVLAAVASAFLAACQPTTTELADAEREAIRDTITQLADAAFEAFRALDIDRFMAPYGSEFVWAENGALGTNRDSMVTAWGGVFASVREVTSGAWGDAHVNVLGPDAAVFSASFEWAGVDTAGVASALRGVWTTVWERTGDGWKIVQGHESYLPPPESM